MGMKMDGMGGNPGMRPAMQPGMGGQVSCHCQCSLEGNNNNNLNDFTKCLHFIDRLLARTWTTTQTDRRQQGFLNAQMMAQRSREMVTMQMRRQRMMMLMQQQQQQQAAAAAAAAAGGFSPPPNVTAPGGMDNPMGGPNMGQPGPQQFGYGGNYGEDKTTTASCW